MTFIKKISLFQYKNVPATTYNFNHKICCIHGANGVGKTNLLDAIYALCYSKSYFSRKDALLVAHGSQGMRLNAEFDSHTATLIIRETGKKQLQINDTDLKSVSEFIGKANCVIIAPDDISLITETGEERRRYFDALLSLIQPDYLQTLGNYNKVLLQRNALLKQSKGVILDIDLLGFYNQKLAEYGTEIYTHRNDIFSELRSHILEHYAYFSEDKEKIEIEYDSSLKISNLLSQLESSLDKDIILQRTTKGVHRDDLIMSWQNGQLFKETASQGQRKTMLFALKLAQFSILQKHLPSTPILLLDDVFEKLDEQRATLLLKFVFESDAQVIITDTHKQRLQKAFEHADDVAYLPL